MASEGNLVKQVHIQGGNEAQQELQKLGPLIVRFPRPVPQVEPIKLVYEEEGGESKSRNMVQVYLMGGYLIARWAWARYQERQARRKFTGRDDKDF